MSLRIFTNVVIVKKINTVHQHENLTGKLQLSIDLETNSMIIFIP